MDPTNLKPGAIVVLEALDDIPEHLFRIDEIYEDCIGGYSLSGPLEGEYGEPGFFSSRPSWRPELNLTQSNDTQAQRPGRRMPAICQFVLGHFCHRIALRFAASREIASCFCAKPKHYGRAWASPPNDNQRLTENERTVLKPFNRNMPKMCSHSRDRFCWCALTRTGHGFDGFRISLHGANTALFAALGPVNRQTACPEPRGAPAQTP
jgi:hypothetical protein